MDSDTAELIQEENLSHLIQTMRNYIAAFESGEFELISCDTVERDEKTTETLDKQSGIVSSKTRVNTKIMFEYSK